MKIFIDNNPKWNGGYLSHIRGFLSSNAVAQSQHEFIVYGIDLLKKKLEPLSQNTTYIVDNNLPLGYYKMHAWRKSRLPDIIREYNPNLHFNTMGWISTKNISCPSITMSRNLQPFIKSALKKASFFSKERIRLNLSRRALIKSYNLADGLIYLSSYAKEIINPFINADVRNTIIPHGVNSYFRKEESELFSNFSLDKTIKVLYVSKVYTYKNHDKVILAVDRLRKKTNLNLELVIVGGISNAARHIINNVKKRISNTSWLTIMDDLPNKEIVEIYHAADIFVFTSSVENFPNIILEAMASGLPIVYSNKRPMTDILGNYGLKCNEEDHLDIAQKIEKIILDKKLRERLIKSSYTESLKYNYEVMSKETLEFLEAFN